MSAFEVGRCTAYYVFMEARYVSNNELDFPGLPECMDGL